VNQPHCPCYETTYSDDVHSPHFKADALCLALLACSVRISHAKNYTTAERAFNTEWTTMQHGGGRVARSPAQPTFVALGQRIAAQASGRKGTMKRLHVLTRDTREVCFVRVFNIFVHDKR
jgi:hypothetical protein